MVASAYSLSIISSPVCRNFRDLQIFVIVKPVAQVCYYHCHAHQGVAETICKDKCAAQLQRAIKATCAGCKQQHWRTYLRMHTCRPFDQVPSLTMRTRLQERLKREGLSRSVYCVVSGPWRLRQKR